MMTIQNILNIADASCIYTSNEISGGNRQGGLIDLKLPALTYALRQGLEWLYDLDPANEDLTPIGNYLFSILKFAAKAENSIVGGGSVPSVSPSSPLAEPIDWIVSGTASAIAPLANGDATVTFDGTGGMPDLRGYNIQFARGGATQYTTNPGDGTTYFSWNRSTGVFSVSQAASTGEQMRIYI